MLSCFSCVQLFAKLWTIAHQAPPSLGFSRQPLGHSGPILTLSNTDCASLPSPRLLVVGAGVCAASPPGELMLGMGSPIFPSGCEGKLGVALESLQGLRDLT